MDAISTLIIQGVCPLAMLLTGLIGNVLIVLVYSRPKFKNSPSTGYLKIVAISDLLSIMTILPYGVAIAGITFLNINQLTCKIFTFFSYFFPTISSWILTLLNIERMISIKYSRVKMLNKKSSQIIFLFIIFSWNLIYYAFHSPYLNLFSYTTYENTSNETTIYCDLEDPDAQVIFAWADLINYTLLPFLVMFLCSVLIIKSIYEARKKFFLNSKKKDSKKIKKDVQFSSLILFLNLAFFLYNLPICLYSFFALSGDLLYWTLDCIFYLQYISNIFIYTLFNKQFQQELFILFRLKKATISLSKTNTN